MALYVPERKVWTGSRARSLSINDNHELSRYIKVAVASGTCFERVSDTALTKTSGIKEGEYLYSAGNAGDKATLSTNSGTPSELTIMCRFARTAINREAGLYSDRNLANWGSNQGTTLMARADGGAGFYVGSGYATKSNLSTNDLLWHTVVGTANVNEIPTLYVDGVKISTLSTSATFTSISSSSINARLFTYYDESSTRSHIGYIDYVYVFYKKLSDIQVYSLLDNPRQIFAPRRQWFAINTNSSTLRVPFKTATGADDNIWLTTDNTLRFNNAAGYYDPIASISV